MCWWYNFYFLLQALFSNIAQPSYEAVIHHLCKRYQLYFVVIKWFIIIITIGVDCILTLIYILQVPTAASSDPWKCTHPRRPYSSAFGHFAGRRTRRTGASRAGSSFPKSSPSQVCAIFFENYTRRLLGLYISMRMHKHIHRRKHT